MDRVIANWVLSRQIRGLEVTQVRVGSLEPAQILGLTVLYDLEQI